MNIVWLASVESQSRDEICEADLLAAVTESAHQAAITVGYECVAAAFSKNVCSSATLKAA